MDKFDVSAGLLTGIVQQQVKATLDATNTSLSNSGHDARVSALPMQFWSPYRLPTQYTNRPNEWYVKLPIMIGIQVHIPHWFDRQVYVPLDLNVSCAGWETGNGVIKIDAVPGPPSFEGGSWIEDAPGLSLIRDAVNDAVRSNFGAAGATSQLVATDKCNALGVLPAQTANDKFAAILFDRPPNRPRRPYTPASLALQSSVGVTFVSLKRLPAHDFHGTVLYQPTEEIVLETYVDFSHQESGTLTMRENDQVNLSVPPVKLKGPLLDPLVVIANINQQNAGYAQDSSWAAWSSSTNFSPGTHTLTIMKSYTMPPGSTPATNKPQTVTVPAYELSYTVQYQAPPVLHH
ncbi:MAG TPA: hypothetical protein VFU86_00625 [Terriglobales bacterium]|nr:hypothetical protein [Terriglobales bacterium]